MKLRSTLTRFLAPALCALLAIAVASPALGGACGDSPPIQLAEVFNNGREMVFDPMVEFSTLTLTVTGPYDFIEEQVIKDGRPVFKLPEEVDDGCYRWQLNWGPKLDPGIIGILKEARESGDMSQVIQLRRDGKIPDPQYQTGGFKVIDGTIIYDEKADEKSFAGDSDFERKASARVAGVTNGVGAELSTAMPGFVPPKDFVINDDLIVDGSACIGFDCVNGESFSFDTIRLKENNLRIKFDDTSVAASFPRTDWQLTANASANGGASKFSIDDISGSRTPFTVEANARSHSLYVDDGGRIGNRTSTPSTEIHTIDGDTPTLRLQQDGSSGFAPQTWDVAGNETNFFIRDVSNGSTLPFRIRPSAPTSAIDVASDGDVGFGTTSPDAPIHATRTSGGFKTMLKLENAGGMIIDLDNSTGAGSDWQLGSFDNGNFVITVPGSMQQEFLMATTGDVTITGTLTQNSDINSKQDFTSINPQEVLSRLQTLPITTWSYRQSPSAVHMGPMAQDFFGAFGLGGTAQGIAPANMAAVAMAAVQGLNAEVEAKDAELDALRSEVEELKAMVAALAGATE